MRNSVGPLLAIVLVSDYGLELSFFRKLCSREFNDVSWNLRSDGEICLQDFVNTVNVVFLQTWQKQTGRPWRIDGEFFQSWRVV